MTDFPYSYLKLPERCILGKPVFKNLFYKNAKLSVTDKRWFTRDIDRIIWKYTIKPSSTLINAVKEYEYEYVEITIIEVRLHNDDHIDRLADIMHRTIPYPLMIIFEAGQWIRFSVADKRFNKADDQAATIKELWVTNRVNEQLRDPADRDFIKQLDYEKQPKLNLKVFYHSWINAFIAYKISRLTGTFQMLDEQDRKQQRIEALNGYRKLEDQIDALRSKLNKAEAFNEKVKLNVDIKELEKQLKQTEKLL